MIENVKIVKCVEVEVCAELTPEDFARHFLCSGSDYQAEVFSSIYRIVMGEWETRMGSFVMQLQYIQDEKGLTPGGLEVMRLIGEYGTKEKE